MNNIETLKNSLLYMYESQPIGDFLKECEINISDKNAYRPFGAHDIIFTVPVTTFKKYEGQLNSFKDRLEVDIVGFHQYKNVNVRLTADWGTLEIISTKVVPVLTPWQEINSMQDLLMNQIQSAGQTIEFQNVGNTARHLLKKLSDIVFNENKHPTKDSQFDTSPESFKNRLWAF